MNSCWSRPLTVVRHTTTRVSLVAGLLATTLAIGAPDAVAQGKKPRTFNLIPISITSVTVQPGAGLVANGLVGTHAFSVPVTLTPLTQPTDGSCPVLDLMLGPIHLSLLGLNVDTSAICLKITAHQGQGLLGDLLCGLGNLLNQGLTLDQALATLDATQLQTLNSGLTQLLNTAVFTPLTSSDAVTSATCSILSLTLGPLDLTLLGLEVELDNCAGGPITLDITATPGGGLLGDLLCNLADLLKGHANVTAILATLRQIAQLLGELVG